MKPFIFLVMTFIIAMTSLAMHRRQDTVTNTHDRNSSGWRTINKARYHILDTAGFCLYSHDQLVQGMKIARPGTVYYFSVTPDSAPIPLTIANLEKAYVYNQTFCYMLHTDFTSDKDLVTIVPSLKTYKVKWAYAKSLK